MEDLVAKLTFKLPAPSFFGARLGPRASNASNPRNLEMTQTTKVRMESFEVMWIKNTKLALSRCCSINLHLMNHAVIDAVVVVHRITSLQVWKKMMKLIPFICNHMEDISAYYQEPQSKSKPKPVNQTMELLPYFSSLHSFIWSGFQLPNVKIAHVFNCRKGSSPACITFSHVGQSGWFSLHADGFCRLVWQIHR